MQVGCELGVCSECHLRASLFFPLKSELTSSVGSNGGSGSILRVEGK